VISQVYNSQILVYFKMPVGTKITFPEGIFFITITCYKWLPLIEITKSYELVYKWFDHLKKNKHYIIGYQIMPNHLHAVIAFSNSGKNINTIIGNGKRYMAYGIIKQLEKSNQQKILVQLGHGVNNSDRMIGKLHEVWEDSFDWKDCRSRKIILQKLGYMHQNACRGKWELVESPVDYIHSSAKYYITGVQGLYNVTHFLEVEDIDLTAGEK